MLTRRLVVVVTLVLAAVTGCSGGDGATVVTAQFRDAAGLFEGNDVGVLGVRVGSVTGVEPNGDHVDVTLRIDEGVTVPDDAGAVIVSRSVATDRYVELTPVYDAGPVLRSGTVLPVAKTRAPVEFDELLGSLTELSTSFLDPAGGDAPLNELLSVAARTLDGKGRALGTSLDGLGDTLSSVDDASADVTGTLDNLDRLTTTLADNDALVRRFSTEVTEATSMLDDQHESLEATFTALSAMLGKVASFSQEHRAEVSDQIDDVTELSEALLAHRAELEETVETLPLTLQNVDRAVDEEDRLNLRVRPADLVPAQGGLDLLCEALPAEVCEGLDLQDVSLLDLLAALAGERS